MMTRDSFTVAAPDAFVSGEFALKRGDIDGVATPSRRVCNALLSASACGVSHGAAVAHHADAYRSATAAAIGPAFAPIVGLLC